MTTPLPPLPAPPKPVVPYYRHIVAGIIQRRTAIFTKAEEQLNALPDSPEKTAQKGRFNYYATQCRNLLVLLDEGKPDEAEALLENLNLDPNMPERPAWSRGYENLHLHLGFATLSIRKRQQKQT